MRDMSKHPFNNPGVVEMVKKIFAKYPEINAVERFYANFDERDVKSFLILHVDQGTSMSRREAAAKELEAFYNSSEDNEEANYTCVSSTYDVLIKKISDYVLERGVDF